MFILFHRNRLSVLEQVIENSVYGMSTLHSNETPVSKYETPAAAPITTEPADQVPGSGVIEVHEQTPFIRVGYDR
jgi:hypothetical protein